MDKLVSGRHGRSQHVTAGQVLLSGHDLTRPCLSVNCRSPMADLARSDLDGLNDLSCSAPQDERMIWFRPVHEKKKGLPYPGKPSSVCLENFCAQ